MLRKSERDLLWGKHVHGLPRLTQCFLQFLPSCLLSWSFGFFISISGFVFPKCLESDWYAVVVQLFNQPLEFCGVRIQLFLAVARLTWASLYIHIKTPVRNARAWDMKWKQFRRFLCVNMSGLFGRREGFLARRTHRKQWLTSDHTLNRNEIFLHGIRCKHVQAYTTALFFLFVP